MKRLTTNQIRQLWFDYFHELGHEVVESSSLVPPANDSTLLLINAGMNQFKDLFLGLEARPYKRAVTAQKCMRVSGKHNDLENVGPSPRHHTFFEMLGNFSFGNYFKKEAIQFAWHLLINELGLPIERMWFTVYTDDDEAERLWIETGAPRDRVLRFGKKDNWWAMGDTGPCGPCSEIHYYWGDLAKQTPAGVNKDDEYLEIWNLVFMQFDQKPDGALLPLPAPSVDTGMGIERLASILQGKDNNYDTDAFTPIMDRIQALLGQNQAHRQRHLYRYRAIADHSRACTFLINDGVLPGNEGRNYVLRMVLRRAARFGKLIGFEAPFLAQVAAVVIEQMGGHYSELRTNRDKILQTITEEEERFHRTLNSGLARLDDLMARLKAQGQHTLPGEEAFDLWETFGFPIDLTRDIADDNGFQLDEAGFVAARKAAQETSRAGAEKKFVQDRSLYTDLMTQLRSNGLLDAEGVKHLIYENLAENDSTVVGLLVDGRIAQQAHRGADVELVLAETPFYAESGGQIGDTGEIYYWPEDLDAPVWRVEVIDTRRRVAGLIAHIGKVTAGTVQVGDPAHAALESERRWDIMRNHTGTHVLHAALRERLGKHVHQFGSLVAPDRLRFDFTHSQALNQDELADIERRANEIVLTNYPVNTRWTTYKRAVQEGAMALFDEKYGDEVRVVSFGEGEEAGPVSMELCGGTHVDSTAEIGSFRILSEGSVSSGVRRVEVTTGRYAEQLIRQRLTTLERATDLLHTRPEQLVRALQQLQEQNQQLQKEVVQLRQKLAQQETQALIERAVRIDGFALLATQVTAPDVETMRQMSDWFRDRLGSSVVVLGALIDEKPMLVAAVTQELIPRGLHAGNLVRDAAKLIGGSGGGRPNIAQAGGKEASKLNEALSSVVGWVQQNLK
jgi:alanyl-tRNA synthetase